MKDSGKVLALVLGAATAIVAIFGAGVVPLSAVGLATTKEVEILRLKVAGLDQALRESESKFQAELERQKREANARSAEEAARKLQAEEASKAQAAAVLKAAMAARLRAEADAATQAKLVQQREADIQAKREAARKAVEDAAKRAAAAPAQAGVSETEAMYQQALALESSGKAADAVRVYRRAARARHGKAALRLGAIFACGVVGVSRDHAESLQWYQTARDVGEFFTFPRGC